MKKGLLVLILVLAIVTSVVTGTLALYNVKLDDLTGDAIAKNFAVSAGKEDNFTEGVKIAPGETVYMGFHVSNKDGTIISEVPMDVEIFAKLGEKSGKTIIPNLTMEMYDFDNNKIGSGEIVNGEGTIYFMSHYPLSATELVNNFKLKITWVSNHDDADYGTAEFGNAVTVSVKATQCVVDHAEDDKNDEDYVYPIDPSTGFNGGSGTENDPYIVATPSAFEKINDKVILGDYSNEGSVYKLVKDLDLGEIDKSKNMLVNSVLDGNGHTVTFKSQSPLFERISGGTIKNLTIDGYSLILVGEESDSLFGYGNNPTSVLTNYIGTMPGGKPLLFENVHITNSTISITPSEKNKDAAISLGAFGFQAYFHDENITFRNCSIENTKIECTSTKAAVSGFIGKVRKEKDNDACIEFVDCYATNSEVFTGSSSSSAGSVGKIAVVTNKSGLNVKTGLYYFVENTQLGLRVSKEKDNDDLRKVMSYYDCKRYYTLNGEKTLIND